MGPVRITTGILLALLAATAPLAAGEGDLDPAFDGDGLFAYTESGSYSVNLLEAPDGATVLWGVRIPPIGSPQVHWRRIDLEGPDSLCATSVDGISPITVQAAAFDADGRLLIVTSVGQAAGLGVLCYLYSQCTLDDTLNGDGIVVHDVDLPGHGRPLYTGIAGARWLLALNVFQRRILVAATATVTPSFDQYDTFLVRLLDNGAIDTGFGGGDGTILLAANRQANDLIRDGSSYFMVGERSPISGPDVDSFVSKFNRDGVPDASFSGDGEQTLDFSHLGESQDRLGTIRVAPDGRLLLAGLTTLDAQPGVFDVQGVLGRLEPDGSLDESFSIDGWRTYRPSFGYSTVIRDVWAQGDGRVLFAATVWDGPSFPAAEGETDTMGLVGRLQPAGALDSSFGSGGTVLFDPDHVANGADGLGGVALGSNGQIWIAGVAETPVGQDTDQKPFAAHLQSSYIFADGFERGNFSAWSSVVN